MESTQRTRLVIDRTWDGVAVAPEDVASVDLVLGGGGLEVEIDAPYRGDPPPPGPAGTTEALWEFEVVELFLLGDRDRYLEIEISPHGHHLVLELAGERNVTRSGHPLETTCRIEGARWSSAANVPVAWLPRGLARANAYAIHGVGADRRYYAAHPVGGDEPDFHRLAGFPRIAWLPTEAP